MLRESDIRPPEAMVGQVESYLRDLGWLLARKNEFVVVDCPACGEFAAQLFLVKNGLTYLECDYCATVYMSPRPSEKLLSEFYSRSENYKYWAKHVFPLSESARKEKIVKPRSKKILEIAVKYLGHSWKFVEVGAGFGTLCSEIKACNVFDHVIAVEPVPELAQVCRDAGLNVIESRFEDAEIGKADMIASFEVIEHLFDPDKFVHKCFESLSPGGILVLSCPNMQGFETMILGDVSTTIDAEHLNYFNPDSLSYLLTESGFDVLEVETPGELDVDLVINAVNNMKIRNQFVNKIAKLSDRDKVGFQEFLKSAKLSSHMLIVGQKPEKLD